MDEGERKDPLEADLNMEEVGDGDGGTKAEPYVVGDGENCTDRCCSDGVEARCRPGEARPLEGDGDRIESRGVGLVPNKRACA